MEEIKEITSLSEFYDIIKKDKYTIIAFQAPWGTPLEPIADEYKKLAGENVATVECCTVDVSKAEDIAHEVNVATMPAFVLYKKGKRILETRALVVEELVFTFNQTKQ